MNGYINKKRIVLFSVFAVLSALWMAVIFGFSSKNAEESTVQSNFVTELLVSIFEDDFDELDEAQRQLLIEKYDGVVRKTAHFCVYALLGFLVYFTAGSLKWIPSLVIKPAAVSTAFCTLFAATDEYHQSFVDGRAGQPRDVLIDGMGALCGTLCAIAVVLIVKKIIRNKKPFA